MSELRERCLVLADKITEEGFIEVSTLEAFAKEQQIKGMEAVKNEMRQSGNERLHGWIHWIEDEIYKLKEGG